MLKLGKLGHPQSVMQPLSSNSADSAYMQMWSIKLTEACEVLLLVRDRQQQLSSIEAAKTSAEAKAAEALETVLAAVPRHRQDLVLIEALDRALDGAKKAATKKFVDSNAAASYIATQIAALQQLLQPQVSTPPLIVSQQAILSLSAALEWCTSQLTVEYAMERTICSVTAPFLCSPLLRQYHKGGGGKGGVLASSWEPVHPEAARARCLRSVAAPFLGGCYVSLPRDTPKCSILMASCSTEHTLCLHMLC